MDILNTIIELLSNNECYVLILGVLLIAYLIINSNNKHHQEMEKIRLEQFNQILNKHKDT